MIDFLLTPALCRAGRALLDLQQSELARLAGLSLSAVKKYEKADETVRAKTRAALQRALESRGIVFLSGGGLRHDEDTLSVMRFSGPDFIYKWDEEIFSALPAMGHEMLTSSTDERWWSHPSVRGANHVFLKYISAHDITIKSLIAEGSREYNLPRTYYRTVPSALLGKITYCLYADRLAFILWKKRQVVVLRNRSAVETFQAQFQFLWKQGKAIG